MSPSRQLLRCDEIRAPDAPNDSLSAAQIAAANAGGQADIDAATFLSAILSQMRTAFGTPSWYSPPPASLATVVQALTGHGGALAAAAAAAIQTFPCDPALAPGQLATLDSDGIATAADCTQQQTVVGMALSVQGSTAQLQLSGAASYAGGQLLPMQSYFLGPGGLPTATLTDDIIYVQRLGVALSPGTLLLGLQGISVKRCVTP